MKKFLLIVVAIVTMNFVSNGQEVSDSTFIANNQTIINKIQKKVSDFQMQLEKDPSASFPRESQISILNLFSGLINLSGNILDVYQLEVKVNTELRKQLDETVAVYQELKIFAEKLIKENEELKKNQK